MRQAVFGLLLLFVAVDAIAGQPPLRRKPALTPPASATGETDSRAGSEDQNARDTRERLSEIVRQYPPSLGHVLRLDPSLLTDERYVAPYPALSAFLTQHPEIAHNPAYFLGEPGFQVAFPPPKLRMLEETLAGLAVLVGFVAFVATVAWLLKALIDYRRWLRLSKIQTDAHTKLLDRFTSNEDLLAYIQTPVGRRFLESTPIAVDAAPRAIGAPIGRILWSVQAGFVVGLAGVGLLVTSSRLGATGGDAADIAPFIFGVAMLALAVGVGFVLSAMVAYGLSRRLGLIDMPPVSPHA